MEKAIRFELRSGCQEFNAKTQGRKAAKKSLLQRSGSPAEIRPHVVDLPQRSGCSVLHPIPDRQYRSEILLRYHFSKPKRFNPAPLSSPTPNDALSVLSNR